MSHFDRAGVGCRHDRNLEIRGHAQHRARAVDGLFELGFSGFGAVRAAEQRALERLQIPARTFLGRTR